MAQRLLSLIERFRSPEDAVFAARLMALGEAPAARRRTGRARVSPFRFVAARNL